MVKQFIRRSSFQFVSLTDANVKSVLVEGDEAYITVMNNNGNSCSVRRELERNMTKAITASGLENTNSHLAEWPALGFSYGRVPLDSSNVFGTLSNKAITTTAGLTTYPEYQGRQNAGFKEVIDLKANTTTYPCNVCIETVHYVPADLIAA